MVALIPPPPNSIPAGLGVSTSLPDMDFETYCELDLTVVGAANYVAHPSFEALTLCYDLKDGQPRRRCVLRTDLPTDLFAYIATGGPIEAWNVMFERRVWAALRWPHVADHQWRCAMAKARAHSLPGRLAAAGAVLDLSIVKDADGTRLLDKFSKPRKPTKQDPRTRIYPLWTPQSVAHLGAELALHRLALEPKAGERRIGTIIRDAMRCAQADADDSVKLLDYNETDIVSEAEASARVPDLSSLELQYWRDDQAINWRGVQVDVAGVHDCIAVLEAAMARFEPEYAELTSGLGPSQVQATLGWLRGRGVALDALDEDAVTTALRGQLPPDVRRVLEIRSLAASASVKKVYALRAHATAAGRVHDLYAFHGAHTGRPTSHGPQAANLPKEGPTVYHCPKCGKWHGAHTMTCPWCATLTVRGPKDAKEWCPEAVVNALEAISTRSFDVVQAIWGNVLLTVSGVLRGLFIAAPGHDLVSSDYTAIEGVVVACLAGEQWRVDAYANDAPMYLLSAERMFGVPVSEMLAYAKANGKHHPLRQKGKGGELGLGFGGWVNALRQFDVDGEEDELKDVVLKWRAASPHLVWFWGGQKKGVADEARRNAGLIGYADRWDKTPFMFGLEGAAVSAVLTPGVTYPVLRMDGSNTGVSYICRDDVLYCLTPSNGLITYHRPRLVESPQTWRGLSLSYEGWNTNPKNGPIGWIRKNTHGGKFCENVVQKVARDIQMSGIAREHRAGYPIVMHTYDEVVAEVPEGFGSVEDLERLMIAVDPWAAGWPIKAAGGWRAKRYRKG